MAEGHSLWQKVIDSLKKVIISTSEKPTFVTEIITQVTNLLENDDFLLAEVALKQHLSSSPKCLVIVDTILDFFKKEEMFIGCVEGLICAVLDLTCAKYHRNLEIKCCIPEEVYPHIKMWEKTKVRDHLIFIEWSQKDLIRMISKRLIHHLLLKKNAKTKEFKEINWDNYDEVKRNAWDRYFPSSIVNAKGQEEETHVYILRHTQQTPREIIRIVNEIVSSLEHERLTSDLDSKTWQLSIVDGVHEAVKSTMQELIESNQYLIPDLDNILSNSFNSKPKVMPICEVRQCLAHSRKY